MTTIKLLRVWVYGNIVVALSYILYRVYIEFPNFPDIGQLSVLEVVWWLIYFEIVLEGPLAIAVYRTARRVEHLSRSDSFGQAYSLCYFNPFGAVKYPLQYLEEHLKDSATKNIIN